MTLMTLITDFVPGSSEVLIAGVPDLARIFHLALEGAGGVIILVQSFCNRPRSHAIGELLGEHIQDCLVLPSAVEDQGELLILLDIAPFHIEHALTLTSLQLEDERPINGPWGSKY